MTMNESPVTLQGIAWRLERLQGVVNESHDRLNSLAARLEPVIVHPTEDVPADAMAVERKPTSAIGDLLNDAIVTVERLNVRIATLSDHVDL